MIKIKHLLLLCSILSIGCIDIAPKTAESLPEKDYQTIEINNLYSLKVPNYMKEYKNLHPDGSLNYANIYKETYSVVIDEKKDEFVDVFKSLGEFDDNKSVIVNYTDVQKKMFTEAIDDIKIEDFELTDINNYPARQIKVSGDSEGTRIFYIISFIEGKDNVYMIMSWTLEERSKKYENTLESINNSFKLL
jgi:hypothetical protein